MSKKLPIDALLPRSQDAISDAEAAPADASNPALDRARAICWIIKNDLI